MSRFDDRLTRGFDEIAERATPSPSAHANFRTRVAQHTPHEKVVIMMTPNDIQPRRPRWALLTVVGASAALALVGIVLLRSETDDTMPSATTAEAPATTVPDDVEPPVVASVDCQSFTSAELNAIVDRAQARAGTDFAFARFNDESPCDSLTDSGQSSTGAEWRTHWPPPSDGMATVRFEPTDFLLEEDGWVPPNYGAHPMLDESVLYVERWFMPGGAVDDLTISNREVVLAAELWVRGGPFVRYFITIHDPEAYENYSGGWSYPDPDKDQAFEARIEAFKAVGYAIANEMLHEMGWID
jgi:hypothetical protein